MRKAERLINLIVLLLETNRPLTPREIHETVPGYGQENWNSFLRMFERDKEELREMGIPLEIASVDAWEKEEGYLIPKQRYYLPDLELDADEVAALWVAAGLLRIPDPGTARIALLKLSGDLPLQPERSRLSWLAADLGLGDARLPVVFQAVSERRGLSFSYRSRDGEKMRRLDPYGLVHRRGAWYAVGKDHPTDEIRSFRLERIVGEVRFADAASTGNEFEVPDGFRPESALDTPPFVQDGTADPAVKALVHFDSSVTWRVERESPWVELRLRDDGSADAELEVTDSHGFISWILWFADEAEVMAPEELRNELRDHLENLCG